MMQKHGLLLVILSGFFVGLSQASEDNSWLNTKTFTKKMRARNSQTTKDRSPLRVQLAIEKKTKQTSNRRKTSLRSVSPMRDFESISHMASGSCTLYEKEVSEQQMGLATERFQLGLFTFKKNLGATNKLRLEDLEEQRLLEENKKLLQELGSVHEI